MRIILVSSINFQTNIACAHLRWKGAHLFRIEFIFFTVFQTISCLKLFSRVSCKSLCWDFIMNTYSLRTPNQHLFFNFCLPTKPSKILCASLEAKNKRQTRVEDYFGLLILHTQLRIFKLKQVFKFLLAFEYEKKIKFIATQFNFSCAKSKTHIVYQLVRKAENKNKIKSYTLV